jgi:hypothetical protein
VFGTGSGDSLLTSTTTTQNLVANDANISTLNVSSLNAFIITVTNVSSIQLSTSTVLAETVGAQNVYTSTLLGDFGSISSLNVSSINGISPENLNVLRSTFSTIYWSTAQGENAVVSSIQISTVMGTDNMPIFTFDMANRRVGVNLGPTQQPRATMDVSGVVYAKGFVTASDRRLKHDIISLESMPIPEAYRYKWNDTGKADIGVMADEVEALAPECVYLRPDGYKAVDYLKLVPICLSLIKNLAQRLESLESRLG